jgi:DNA polymerase III sliding clamp (beta) subunit (PCNA family)
MKNIIFAEVVKQALKERAAGYHVAKFEGDCVKINTGMLNVELYKHHNVNAVLELAKIKAFKLTDINADLTVKGNALPISEREFFQGAKDENKILGIQHMPANFINARWLKMTGKPNEVRYYLKGMHFKRENNKLQIVGSDGHQLIMNTAIGETGPDFSALIPSEALIILSKIKTSCLMTVTETHAKFTGPDWTIETRLIDSKYPDFSKVFNTTINGDVDVNRKALIQAIKDVTPFLPPKLQGVVLTVTDKTLHFNHHGDTLASVPFIHSSGTKTSEGIDVGYLLNALECYKDEKIMLSFRESLIQINRDTFQTSIIMGMRL